MTIRRDRFAFGFAVLGVVAVSVVASCASGGNPPTTNSPQAVKVGFIQQPTTVTVSAVIAPTVTVAIEDAQGNTVTTAATPVTISITAGRGTAGAVLGGTLTRNAVSGIAQFSDLTIDAAGTNFALTASAPSLSSATSSGFDVSASGGGGGTLLFEETYENANLASRGWYDNTNVLLSTSEHVSGSTSSAEYHFLQNATGPTSGGSQRHKFTPTNSLYVSYYVKYSANWVGSGKAYHPHEFYALSTLDGDYDGPANNWLTIYLEQNYQNGGRPRMAMQDNKSINTSQGALPNNLVAVTENRSTGGCNGVSEASIVWECYQSGPSTWYNDKQLTGPVTFQPTAGPGYKNDWNFVEAYYQLNTVVNGIGQADGVMQYWFNGTLVIDRKDIVYRTGAHPTLQFSQFLIAPYIGDGSPVDQSMFVDNLKVATGRLP